MTVLKLLTFHREMERIWLHLVPTWPRLGPTCPLVAKMVARCSQDPDAKPKESVRSNEAKESKNDTQMIRKEKQKAANWSQKGGKLEAKRREKGSQVAIGSKIAFGSHFGSHFGDPEGAKGQPMGAKRRPKSRKIASKFDVHCGMHLRKAT